MAEDIASTDETPAPKVAGLTATLVYGETYYLGNKRFEVKKPVSVTEAEAAALKPKVVSRTIIDGDKRDSIDTPRFKIEGSAPAAPRARAPRATA